MYLHLLTFRLCLLQQVRGKMGRCFSALQCNISLRCTPQECLNIGKRLQLLTLDLGSCPPCTFLTAACMTEKLHKNYIPRGEANKCKHPFSH